LNKAEKFNSVLNYDSAFVYYQKASKIFKDNNNLEKYLYCQIKAADYYRIKGNYKKTKKIISFIEKQLYLISYNKLLLSDLLHLKGTLNFNENKYTSAIKNLKNSIKIKTEINGINDTNLAKSYNNLGSIYYNIGKYNKALNYYNKALKNSRQKKDTLSPDIAMYYQNIGIVYAIKGDYNKAMLFFKKNLKINEKLLKKDDPNFALIYLNIGRLLNLTGKYVEALEYHDKAENIYKTKFDENYSNLAVVYLNKGTIYSSQSDYNKALSYFNKALSIFGKNYKANNPQILKTYMNIGYVYKKQGDFNNALKYYYKSMSNNKDLPSLIKTYRNLANCYKALDNIKKANYYYNLSIKKAKETFGNNSTELALSYLYYGDFCSQRNNFKKGLILLNKAYTIYLKQFGAKNRDVSNCLSRIGILYKKQGKYKKALEYFQKSITSILPEYNNTNIYSNPDEDKLIYDYYLLNALNNKGEALLELYEKDTHNINDIIESFKTYSLSIKLLEKIRFSYLSEESKLLLTERETVIFPNAIKAALILYSKTENPEYYEYAYSFSEKSKAAILLASMKDSEAEELAKIPQNIQLERKNLKQDIALYKKFIYEENHKTNPGKEKIKFWKNKLFNMNNKYDSIIKTIEKEYPEYYHLKYDYSTVSIKSLQKKLKKEEALIEYTVSDSLLFTFIITKNTINYFTDNVDSTLNCNIKILRNELIGKNYANYNFTNFTNFTNSAYFLYKKLIAPAEKIIKGKKLIIIPDDKLGYIPFEILLYDNKHNTMMNYHYLPYLIKKHAISYSYSATLIHNNKKKYFKLNNKVLAFGNSYSENNDINFQNNNITPDQRSQLIPIPGVEHELKMISNIAKTKIFKNREATESNFKKYAKDYDILNLAMHTIIDDENPMYSKLVFNNETDLENDGYLTTYELFNMKLNADLAVLSSCNTGSGILRRGEGIMSLARGFIYSGVSGIVMTLWTVNDKTSSNLIKYFYENLMNGESKDDALRAAKLKFLKNSDQLNAHPHYWAGYVCIGNTKPLSSDFNFLLTISISLIFILSIIIFIRKKKNRNQIKNK
ncbi:MAG: tetratricopeptide repeat protein, partial [Bacteroidales bacterium]|nr:tetratricopeptide repeat protein [Bacteroidales bacterium]